MFVIKQPVARSYIATIHYASSGLCFVELTMWSDLQQTSCRRCATMGTCWLPWIRRGVCSSWRTCWISCGATRTQACSRTRWRYSTTSATTLSSSPSPRSACGISSIVVVLRCPVYRSSEKTENCTEAF